MEGFPEKLTLNVEEVVRLLGISRNGAYEMVRTGQLPSIAIGSRRLIARHALAEFLGAPSGQDNKARPTSAAARHDASEAEENEWTYVITVKRLRSGETARIERPRTP